MKVPTPVKEITSIVNYAKQSSDQLLLSEASAVESWLRGPAAKAAGKHRRKQAAEAAMRAKYAKAMEEKRAWEAELARRYEQGLANGNGGGDAG
jgi:hypothetical protein